MAIWRWKFNRTATYQSDRLHFHQLVMRYLEIRFLGRQKRRLSNPLTLIVIAPMLLLPQALGLIYTYDHQKAVIATLLMSALFIVTCVTGIRQAKNVSKNVSLARRVLSTIAAE